MKHSFRREKGDSVPPNRFTRKKAREIAKAQKKERRAARKAEARARNARPGPDSDVATYAAGLGG